MTDFRLDPKQVEETFAACLTDDAEAGIEVDMIVGRALLDKSRVADHAELIGAMLLELPVGFRKSGGGGWSFLYACNDRHGHQWTGLHRTMAMLFALGQAAGLAECQFPRDMWDVLPGGMPYYVINDDSAVPTA